VFGGIVEPGAQEVAALGRIAHRDDQPGVTHHGPFLRLEQIHGSNRHFLLSAIPHIERLLAPGLDALLDWAEHLVIAQKPSAEMRARIEAAGAAITNLVE